MVIGILIALQVDNWSDKRKNLIVSDQTLQILQTELKEAKSRLENEVAFLRNSELVSNKYLKGEYNMDSIKINPFLIYQIVFVNDPKIYLPILERELTSEGLIDAEEDLKANLTAWYCMRVHIPQILRTNLQKV